MIIILVKGDCFFTVNILYTGWQTREEKLEAHKSSNSGTGLTLINGHELDAHEAKAVPEEVNFLREKTFTRELSTLVSRIFNNESGKQLPLENEEVLKISEKNKTMLEYEKLIYSIKHNKDRGGICSRYNPFNLDIDVHDDIDDMDDYISAGMAQTGFKDFGVFKYILKESAFRFDMGNFSDTMMENCFFGISDPIFKGVFPERGILLTSETIAADPFLSKKLPLQSRDEDKEHCYYINKISNYCRNIFSNTADPKLTRLEILTSPLVAVYIPDKKDLDESDIHTIISKNLSIPFSQYLSQNRLTPVMNDYNYDESILLIEIFQKLSLNSALRWCIIRGEEFSSIENFFMLKYLLSKIHHKAGSNSLIMRVASNNIVMALGESDMEDVKNSLNEFNRGSGLTVSFSYIDENILKSKNKLIELFI